MLTDTAFIVQTNVKSNRFERAVSVVETDIDEYIVQFPNVGVEVGPELSGAFDEIAHHVRGDVEFLNRVNSSLPVAILVTVPGTTTRHVLVEFYKPIDSILVQFVDRVGQRVGLFTFDDDEDDWDRLLDLLSWVTAS